MTLASLSPLLLLSLSPALGGEPQTDVLYTIEISNESDETVQLVSRHWIITDATGRVEEVKGSGVVGEQPVLEPGAAFEYTSGCPLTTPFGTMHGSYQMVAEGGTHFEAEISEFVLREPGAVH